MTELGEWLDISVPSNAHPMLFITPGGVADTIAELTVGYAKNHGLVNYKIVDLGAGTGALSVSLANRSEVKMEDILVVECDEETYNELKNYNFPSSLLGNFYEEEVKQSILDFEPNIVISNPPWSDIDAVLKLGAWILAKKDNGILALITPVGFFERKERMLDKLFSYTGFVLGFSHEFKHVKFKTRKGPAPQATSLYLFHKETVQVLAVDFADNKADYSKKISNYVNTFHSFGDGNMFDIKCELI
jgi:hypothetical protein